MWFARQIFFSKNYNSKGSRLSEPHAGQVEIGFSPTSLLKIQPQSVHTLRSAFTIFFNTLPKFLKPSQKSLLWFVQSIHSFHVHLLTIKQHIQK